jgi:hypothetical protein
MNKFLALFLVILAVQWTRNISLSKISDVNIELTKEKETKIATIKPSSVKGKIKFNIKQDNYEELPESIK